MPRLNVEVATLLCQLLGRREEPLAMHDERERAFLEAVNSTDRFTQAVKGYQFLDELAGELLAELLPEDHTLELERMSFLLKLDLVMALGLLRKDLRPLAVRINRIRNLFAHTISATLAAEGARELFELVPPFLRDIVKLKEGYKEDPQYVLSRSVCALYLILTTAIGKARDDKVRDAELGAMVDEVCLPESQYTDSMREGERDRNERIEARVAAEKAKRNAEGRL